MLQTSRRSLRPFALVMTTSVLLTGCQTAILPQPSAILPGAQSLMAAKRSVIGRVYDENDMPYHGDTVTARMVDPTQRFANGEPVYVAKIDRGDFGLANLTPPCTFTVTVDLPGYRSETQTFELKAGGPPVVRGPVFRLNRLPR
jgi:hypothetical protein